MSASRNPVRLILVGLIRGYQMLISPALPRRCKYYPSCSQYALDAVSAFGLLRGSVLAAWRLLRCNPLSYGGYDPVEKQRLFKGADPGALRGAAAPNPAGSEARIVEQDSGWRTLQPAVPVSSAGIKHNTGRSAMRGRLPAVVSRRTGW